MSEKYTEVIGRFHLWRESLREKWSQVREEGGLEGSLKQRTNELKEKAIADGMLTLRRVALLNAMRGVTSIQEVLRVTLDN